MNTVQISKGDITQLPIAVIVNAANQSLLGGGGVDGAIHAAAGPELVEACRKIEQLSPGVRCPTGEARITPGFKLAADYVIHTVGPVWQGGAEQEPQLLASCYRQSLLLAEHFELPTIAFPAISCGVFGYPIDQAAQITRVAIHDMLPELQHIRRIQLVAFNHDIESSLRAAFKD